MNKPASSVRAWVPVNCKLLLVFDHVTGWSASLRLRDDYLGYLVTARRADNPETAIDIVKAAFLEGLENPTLLDAARVSYFRQAIPSQPESV